MSESARIRSFVALDLQKSVLVGVQTLQQQLANTRADVRWVRREGLHVMLKFLGAVEASQLEPVHRALAAAVGTHPALHVEVQGLGAFPSLRRPRVLWVGLRGAGLVELAARVDAALVPLGFAPEARAFTPHITLARVNTLRGWPRLEEAFTAHLDDAFGDCDINVVTIYRSELQRGGAVYTPLWTIPLAENKEGTL